MPTAPRLNLGAHPTQGAETSAEKPRPAPSVQAPGLGVAQRDAGAPIPAGAHAGEQAAVLKALRQLVADTEDVGDRFTQEVRRMHYGDCQVRSVRGQASLQDAVDLLEEGIDVLPLPASLRETLQ